MYRYYMPLELSEVDVHILKPPPLLQPLGLFALLSELVCDLYTP